MFNKYLPSISFHVNIFFFVTFDHIATLLQNITRKFPYTNFIFGRNCTMEEGFSRMYSRLKGCACSSHAYGE